jgi:L-asparaginase
VFSTIDELTSWDIPVVVASRARAGSTSLEDLTAPHGLAAAVGAIGARGLPATKARYALMAALSTGGVTRCREWFSRL